MNTLRMISVLVLFLAGPAGDATTQRKLELGDNAALRYWAAFSAMQDSGITDQQAKELTLILEGMAPYDDLKYRDLVEKNRPALEVMARGTALPNCDWGLDYELRDQTPVEYVRKALPLGRLNVLFAFHLMINGDRDGAVRTLAAGMRFSRDVANGGSLFATLVAKDLLTTHFRAAAFELHFGLSSTQRLILQRAVAQLGSDGLDWQSAMRREMGALNRPDWQMSVPLGSVTRAYVAVLQNPSTLPQLEKVLVSVPQPLRDVIPNPKEVLEQKQEFSDKLGQIRSLLR